MGVFSGPDKDNGQRFVAHWLGDGHFTGTAQHFNAVLSEHVEHSKALWRMVRLIQRYIDRENQA